MKNICAVILLTVLIFVPSCVAQDEPHHHHDAGEKLGTVSFLVSCAPATQAEFDRSMALLYSFEYETASNQFEEIQKKDPNCAMLHFTADGELKNIGSYTRTVTGNYTYGTTKGDFKLTRDRDYTR